jgi:pyruvate dehydrogenase E2 component (dihydrolipoamide acetyltransferase)
MPEIDVPMPKMSMTMEEGELLVWRVAEGEQVRAGDVICEVMSDKVEMEVESPADGTLIRHTVAEGETVAVGAPIAKLDSETEELLGDLFAPAPEAEPALPSGPDQAPTAPAAPQPAAATEDTAPRQPSAGAAAPPSAPAPSPAPTGDVAVAPGQRVKASPLARVIAKEHRLNLGSIKGSGRGGRILREDVLAIVRGETGGAPAATPAAAPASAAPAQVPVAVPADGADEIPLSSMRKMVARRLVESMQSAPHFYLTVEVDVEPLLKLRSDLNNDVAEQGIKVSVNDLLVKACATALRMHPGVNVSWAGDKVLKYEQVHIGIAVALEGGLIVPVIRDADRKSLIQIASEAKALIAKAREGGLSPQEVTGGTFTISNLGMFGIEQFTAVINPPEAAILAVGATTRAPVAVGDDVVIRSQMKLTLSIDHRPLDGATAAAFLATLKDLLEVPFRITA